MAPTARVGGFLHSGDQDYFRLDLPHAGLLYVETTGWSNTVGTVWQGGVELGSAELGGWRYNFHLGVPVQPGPVVIRVAEQSRTAFGTYRLYTRFIAGQVNQPPPLTVQNGLGMVTDVPDPGGRRGIGLKNVDERLRVIYGANYHLKLHSAPGEGTRARIEIPELAMPRAATA